MNLDSFSLYTRAGFVPRQIVLVGVEGDRLQELLQWLKQLLRHSTGEGLTAKPFIDYAKTKYSNLFDM